MENMTLNRQRQRRAWILIQLVAGKINTAEAASSLGLSIRQIERLRPAYQERGVAALIHANSGKHPRNTLTLTTQRRIVDLLEKKYAGFNYQHFTDMLNEIEGIAVSRSTVRRNCIQAQQPAMKPQKRRTRHRSRRERRHHEGEMIQLDGSPHDWLEGRGPKLTLINGIDDATGIKWGRFRESEDLEGYMQLLRNVIEDKGIPSSVYTDRTVIAAGSSNGFRPQREHAYGSSQFKRVLQELGITLLLAESPQAKGRVERTHGTDQDRLCSLLRLAKASTLEEANVVLQFHLADVNQRFTVVPIDDTPEWRSTPPPRALDEIFCIKEQRRVANDNTVKIHGTIFDIAPGPGSQSYSGAAVDIHRRYDVTIGIFLNGKRIAGVAPLPRSKPKALSKPSWLKPYSSTHRQSP